VAFALAFLAQRFESKLAPFAGGSTRKGSLVAWHPAQANEPALEQRLDL
jgi:hypothetical protein